MSSFSDIEFSVLDWKNENVLSSYALEQTPLRFVPDLEDFSYVRVLWDFGDGTISSSLTAEKYWENPGKYVVNFTLYDCYSNAVISTEYKIIHIIDYLKHTFTVDFDSPPYYDNISWKLGQISDPITIKAYYPPTIPITSLFYRISGSNSDYYFDELTKFRHLDKTYAFHEKIYNNYLSSYQYQEIDRITTDNTSVYAKISGTNLINATESDNNSFFVGVSGTKDVHFKDDSINRINIDLFFDRSVEYLNNRNNTKISLSALIVDNDEVADLSITSNGLDGEFYEIDSFKIDGKKFSHVDIPFVIKIKDSENFSVKNFPLLSASNVNVLVLSGGDVVNSSYYELEDVGAYYGSARGKIKLKTNDVLHYVQLSANLTTTNNQGSSYSLVGITDYFDVYPRNYIFIEKKNEDFDAQETFKSLRFQEFLLDKTVLFDDFMGSVFGTLSSSYDTLGKKIYEKITNFVENTQDVDRCEIFPLISQMRMTGVDNDVFESNLFTYPEKIKRILDLGSISKNKLIGYNNKFKENFDIKGFSSKEIFGTNLGNEINTDTYIISAGIPIVALEKFSNRYVLLNTEQPTEETGLSAYMLSGYNANWGWPLVLPDIYQYSDLEKYYLFFEYQSGYENTLVDNTIVYNYTLYDNLSSKHVLRGENGEPILTETSQPIFEEFDFDYNSEMMNISFRDTLYQSLSLYHLG
jgi:hypothetical protein